MHTLIAAGGSGTKVLEAVLHLCAAGLGPEKLRLLVIDADGSNGATTRTKNLVNSYLQCHRAFASREGKFFWTDLDLIETPGAQSGLKVWDPTGGVSTFYKKMNVGGLPSDWQSAVDLFFTEEEQTSDLSIGFRGHPAIGAAALSLLPLYKKDPIWGQIVSGLRGELNTPAGATFMIAGSVFGGTGAATLYPVSRFLKAVSNPDNLEKPHPKCRIGALAMAPYFQFNPAKAADDARKDGKAAKAELFPLATKSAAEFYHSIRMNKDWPFDAMYWLGDDSPEDYDYSIGGPTQANPPHFVDLLSAFACLDFFATDGLTHGHCHYAGPATATGDLAKVNTVLWESLPFHTGSTLAKRAQSQLLSLTLAGAMHCDFLGGLIDDSRLEEHPARVPWYWDKFLEKKHSLRTPEAGEKLKHLTAFFKQFHFPWWNQVHAGSLERVRLFNRTVFKPGTNAEFTVDLQGLRNLLADGGPGITDLEGIDEFLTEMVKK